MHEAAAEKLVLKPRPEPMSEWMHPTETYPLRLQDVLHTAAYDDDRFISIFPWSGGYRRLVEQLLPLQGDERRGAKGVPGMNVRYVLGRECAACGRPRSIPVDAGPASWLDFLLPAFAAGDEDSIYLKDGSILKGTIKSLTEEALTFVTGGGLELTIPMSKVDRFERKGESVAQTPKAAEATPVGPLAFEANLLGFLQFGPYARVHIRLLDNVFLSPHVRVGYAGALGYLLFDNPDIGAGVSVLYFLPSSTPNRWYAGSFTEFAINSTADSILNVGANIGYRWRFPGGSYWNTGVIAGISYNFYREFLFPFGMAELSWGIEF